jgi:hypothetical protein
MKNASSDFERGICPVGMDLVTHFPEVRLLDLDTAACQIPRYSRLDGFPSYLSPDSTSCSIITWDQNVPEAMT